MELRWLEKYLRSWMRREQSFLREISRSLGIISGLIFHGLMDCLACLRNNFLTCSTAF